MAFQATIENPIKATPHLALLLSALVWLAACGESHRQAVKKDASTADAVTDGGEGGAADGGGSPGGEDGRAAGEDSVAAFARTVHPVVQAHCAGCHSDAITPFFADTDTKTAHDALIVAQKVDLTAPRLSRLYQRLAGEKEVSHNCWSDCATNATEMLAAIEDWAAAVKPSDGADTSIKTTTALMLADATVSTTETKNPANVLAFEAESAVLKAPAVALDLGDASGGKVVHTPANAGSQVDPGIAATAANLGTMTFDFEVTEPGDYRVLGLVNGSDAAANSFYLRLDSGPLLVWRFEPNAAAYTWDVADAAEAVGTPHLLTLAAGAHKLEVRQRERLAKLDMLIVTSDATLDPTTVKPGATQSEISILSFDLSALTGVVGAKLTVEISDYSANAYLFRNPRLIADANIHVKGLKLLINDAFLSQHATYTIVDKTVSAPGDLLSSSALVALKDKGIEADQFSFSFETLEVIP